MYMVNIFWFRRDLRVDDNHGLYKALTSGIPVVAVYIIDPDSMETEETNPIRTTFVRNALIMLHQKLIEFGSGLHIIQDSPLNAFTQILQQYNVKAVYANHEYEPHKITRDTEIASILGKKNISFLAFKDQVIFEKNEVIKSDGKPYTVFTPYANAWKRKLAVEEIPLYPSQENLHSLFKLQVTQLPFSESTPLSLPQLPDENLITNYTNARDIPAIDGTSRISAHLRFGTVSIREWARKAMSLNTTWLNELIWREFFTMILWHCPYLIDQSFKPKYDAIPWRNNESEFDAWTKGETGYPMIDAGMRQLNKTGWMHNRARMLTASFLSKHLLIDWRWGEAYFGEKLVDYDLAVNNGNWQWCAGCGCDAAPYFRIFNPETQQKKFDPEFTYIKKYIPDFNVNYLPKIVDHEYARERALATYKKALSS